MPESSTLKLQEKVAYGFGDFACSMFWKLFSMFLLFFYTDVFGITAAAAGTMFLVTRIWDSANDPIMGMIGDRTRTRWGKFRPYLLFGAVPFAIIGVLTFTRPDLSEQGRLIYAYITYTLMMMAYTAVNVPYASLLGVMTSNSEERTTLATWRFIGGFSGSLLVAASANSMVEYFSVAGDAAVGYQRTIMVYAVVAVIFFVLTFAGTKEQLQPAVEKSSLKDDLRDMAKNGPWFIMLGAGIATLVSSSLRDATILYYFKYFIGDQSVLLIGAMSQSALASVFMSTLLGASIIGVLLAKPVSSRIGKKNTFMLSGVVTAILSILFYFIPSSEVEWIFIVNILIGIASGVLLPLVWSMYGDVSDFSEWKTGRRATGLIFSSSSMSQKIGWTIGGAISGWLLAAYGFEANAVQTTESLMGIRLMISVYAGIGALLSVAFMYFYPLDEQYMQDVSAQLDEARINAIVE